LAYGTKILFDQQLGSASNVEVYGKIAEPYQESSPQFTQNN
jgi:hypothetical protein